MAEEFKTLREVGHGIESIRTQLSLYAAVFGGVVVIAGAAYGFMFSKLDNVEDAIARVETTVTSIAGDAKQTRADVGDVKTAMNEAAPKSKEESELIAKFKDAFGPEFVVGDGVKQASYGEVELLVKGLTPEMVKELSGPCDTARSQPAGFSLATLGACAAIVNTAAE